jgi:CRISPR-associated protein Cas1
MDVQSVETLIVEEFGAFVGKHSERLRVSVKHDTRVDAPLIYLRQVIIKSRGVTISSDAIAACAERGISIHVVNGVGLAQGAALYAAGFGGTVQTRRAQLLAFADARGVALACAFARAKLTNQANLLKYLARNHKDAEPALHKDLLALSHEVSDHLSELDAHAQPQASWPNVDAARGALLSIEGRAAKRYWEGVKRVMPPELGWPGRHGRGARDPFNGALNYGYAILARVVEQAIVCAGLDPFAGFVHVDRPGKPSLTLDLIEEFRQAVVDRTVLGMVGNRMPLTLLDNGLLDDTARHALAEKIMARVEQSAERYEGKKHCLREIIQTQARHLATFVRGDRAAYEGYIARW